MLIDQTGKPIIPQQARLFPAEWKLKGLDGTQAVIILNADGTCRGKEPGDLEAAMDILADLPPDPNVPVLWLLANALRQQLERNAKRAPVFADDDFSDTMN